MHSKIMKINDFSKICLLFKDVVVFFVFFLERRKEDFLWLDFLANPGKSLLASPPTTPQPWM